MTNRGQNVGVCGAATVGQARLAVRWAIDYLSWDETDPGRRNRVLRRYLSDPAAAPAGVLSGWDGHGRQRASFAVVGRALPDEQDPAVVWVAVDVLVTAYMPAPGSEPHAVRESLTEDADTGEDTSGRRGQPSAAPAPDAAGWHALDSEWMAIEVAVRGLTDGRLVIDPDLDPSLLDPADLRPVAQGA